METEKRNACEYVLRLFVAGDDALSHRAVNQVKEFCETFSTRCCELQIVDVLREPETAQEAQILAVPTLIGIGPASSIRLVGDIVERRAVMLALGLDKADDEPGPPDARAGT
ncbi:MAG: circadian clock protein KaiB [Gammaproteobacteria bacterium]|nr:circadian clock protein KaiB [Gammaproteobacteria bacterium]NIV50443.1 circadian clock protein KaiB [Gammaproteobacteria bacterium]